MDSSSNQRTQFAEWKCQKTTSTRLRAARKGTLVVLVSYGFEIAVGWLCKIVAFITSGIAEAEKGWLFEPCHKVEHGKQFALTSHNHHSCILIL